MIDEKEKIALQIQVLQERVNRLNASLYYIPFEKKAYEDALNELQGKQAELSNTTKGEKEQKRSK